MTSVMACLASESSSMVPPLQPLALARPEAKVAPAIALSPIEIQRSERRPERSVSEDGIPEESPARVGTLERVACAEITRTRDQRLAWILFGREGRGECRTGCTLQRAALSKRPACPIVSAVHGRARLGVWRPRVVGAQSRMAFGAPTYANFLSSER